MKKLLLFTLLFLAFATLAQAQSTTDSLVYAPLTSTASSSFVLKYPGEISIWWDRWAPIGGQIDTLWVERYNRNSDTWQKVRFYNEGLGTYDTLIVKDRQVDFVVPIHAVPTKFRLNSYGTQTDTVKIEYRW